MYYISIAIVAMATELGKIATYLEGLLTTKSFNKRKPLHLNYQSAFSDQTWHDDNYFNGFLLIRSRDSLIMWSCEIK